MGDAADDYYDNYGWDDEVADVVAGYRREEAKHEVWQDGFLDEG